MISEKLNDGKYKFSIGPEGQSNFLPFENREELFLYNRNKTIGFRKDRKLNKFVGLRDGYSKQLEFTLVSIILDENEQIPKNRVNFNSVSLKDESVIHNINGVSILNKISDSNFKNLVKIDNQFKDLEILYEVHIKGLKISNSLNDKKYNNINNQFIFVDDGNNEPMFIFDKPVIIEPNGKHRAIVEHSLYEEDGKLFYKKSLNNLSSRYSFPLLVDANVDLVNLNTNGVGVLSSSGTSWMAVTGGTGTVSMIHNSSLGTEKYAIGVDLTNGNFILNRTFLTFDTTSFSGETGVLGSVILQVKKSTYFNEPIAVMVCTSGDTDTELSTAYWAEIGEYLGSSDGINSQNIIEIKIPLDKLDLYGLTRFALISENYDYNGDVPYVGIFSFTGIDFKNTKLEVIYEPVKVYGQTTIDVIKGDDFMVYAYTNSGSTSDIEWFRDSGYTNFLQSGQTYLGYSMEFEVNNKIYAVINTPNGYSEPLIITINNVQLDYAVLPDKLINYTSIDIDSMYFKYHKCMSGVCFSYARDINNIYEGNPLVGDSTGNESYNLYNEFDIIDEFFSNSHEVDVAYNSNLDLTKRYNQIDGVILYKGTRVMLTNQNDISENGVYTTNYDNTLTRTDELSTYDKLFRYKAHVKYGTYIDQEIHIWTILPPQDSLYIDLDSSGITFNGIYPEEITLSVTSNVSWVISEHIPWISISTSGGLGDKSMTITTTMDNLTGLMRTGYVEFSGFGVTTILEVNQLP